MHLPWAPRHLQWTSQQTKLQRKMRRDKPLRLISLLQRATDLQPHDYLVPPQISILYHMYQHHQNIPRRARLLLYITHHRHYHHRPVWRPHYHQPRMSVIPVILRPPPTVTGGESIYRTIMNRSMELEVDYTLYARHLEKHTAAMRDRLGEKMGRLEGIVS